MSQIKITKNFNMNVPSWETLINNFNYSVVHKNLIKSNPLGFFVSYDANLIEEVKKVLQQLKLNEAHLYMNLAVEKNTMGRHDDFFDVWFWQVQGSTKWIFDDQSYILEQGDLIFVPKLIYHNTCPLTPRAGISMSL